MGKTFMEALGSMGNMFKDALGSMGTTIKNALSAVGSFIVDGIKFVLKPLFDFIVMLLDMIAGASKWLVSFLVPDGEFFTSQFERIQLALGKKFAFLEVFKNMMPKGLEDLSSYRIKFIGDTYIDFDWFIPYQAYIKGITSVTLYTITAVGLFRRLRPQLSTNG